MVILSCTLRKMMLITKALNASVRKVHFNCCSFVIRNKKYSYCVVIIIAEQNEKSVCYNIYALIKHTILLILYQRLQYIFFDIIKFNRFCASSSNIRMCFHFNTNIRFFYRFIFHFVNVYIFRVYIVRVYIRIYRLVVFI